MIAILATLAQKRRLVILGVTSLLGVACVISTTTHRQTKDKALLVGTFVTAPIKAHLLDGSVVLFTSGVSISATDARGTGRRLDVTRRIQSPSTGVPMDSVVGFEVYQRDVNPFRTLIYGSASLAAAVIGTAALAVAIFGSCPTIYADSAGVATLQAESFSYSISPLLAKRDVDRMTVLPDSSGVIRLAVRNEALETHHLDQMEIVEVRHQAGEVAVPSPRGGPIAYSGLVTDANVVDGAGRNVSRIVGMADAIALSTDDGLLDRAIAGGPTEDHLTITVPRRGADSVALVLKARSSLLTTSVLYEHLMGRQGALALDWMADLSRITTLAQLGAWYGGNFGMRVEFEDGARWHSVIRLMDFGPTAWRTVGLVVPAGRNSDDSIRIRLTYTADAFRIDQAAVSHHVRRVDAHIVSIARATDSEHRSRPDIVSMLSRADDREVETHPGDQFWLEFDAGKAPPGTRTYFFAAQGYYVEWLRPDWMQGSEELKPFSPTSATMRELLRSWKGGRDSLEASFFSRRVPIV